MKGKIVQELNPWMSDEAVQKRKEKLDEERQEELKELQEKRKVEALVVLGRMTKVANPDALTFSEVQELLPKVVKKKEGQLVPRRF